MKAIKTNHFYLIEDSNSFGFGKMPACGTACGGGGGDINKPDIGSPFTFNLQKKY